MKRIILLFLTVAMVIVLVACGNSETQTALPPAVEEHTPDMEDLVEEVEEREYISDTVELPDEEVEYYSVNSVLFEGVYFDISEVFIVETITELTQYHLSEEERYDTTFEFGAVYMREYHMNEPVLFIPVTITTIETHEPALNAAGEPIGDPDYRFRPELRMWTPSGRISTFEADTLNGRRFFQSARSDILNYEGAVTQGYLAFVWEGYGEYRVEIRQDSVVIEEFIFDVNNNNVVHAFGSVNGDGIVGAQGSQGELDEFTISMIHAVIASINPGGDGLFNYTIDFDSSLNTVFINLWNYGIAETLLAASESEREHFVEIFINLSYIYKETIAAATRNTNTSVAMNFFSYLNLEVPLLTAVDGTLILNAFEQQV